MQNPPHSEIATIQKSKPKSRISKRQRKRLRNKQKLLNENQNKSSSKHTPTAVLSKQRNGAEIWQEAYHNAVRWHGEHQINFWRRTAEDLQKENHLLRQQLEQRRLSVIDSQKYFYYETSDDDDDAVEKKVKIEKSEEGDNKIDGDYLEFLQITFKHREELRLKRQAEAQEIIDSLPVQVESQPLD